MTRIIGIVSGKGGVGKTTFSTNLAIALSNLDKKVVVIDCNITTPHLAHYLGARHYSSTLNDVFRGELDIKHAPLNEMGVLFIPASEDIKDLTETNIGKLKKQVERLASSELYDFILLDSAPGLGKEALSVLDASEEIIFVTTPTLHNLIDVTRCAEVAKDYGDKKFRIAVNMVRNSKFELKPEEIISATKLQILGAIPFDGRIMDSAAKGIPILWDRPSSHVYNTYMEAAAKLVGTEYRKPMFQKFLEKIKRR